MLAHFDTLTVLSLVIVSQVLVHNCTAEINCAKLVSQPTIVNCKSTSKFNVFDAYSVVTVSSVISQVLQLNANSCGIYKIVPGVFAILNTLTHLDLSDNSLNSLIGLEPLIDLLFLDISRNNILALSPAKIFGSHPHLNKLVISENPIDTYNEKLFFGNPELVNLDISINDLTVLPAKLFDKNIHLQKLNISRNRIAILPPNIFNGLTNLKELDLSDNRLATIPPNIFIKNTIIRIVNLAGNQMNTLDVAVFQKTPKLNTLIVSRNKLTNSFWNVTESLKMLTELNLDKNIIDEVYSFVSFPILTHFSIACNNITQLPVEFFGANLRLKKMSVYGNPWKCPCYRMMMTSVENGQMKVIPGYQTNHIYPVCGYFDEKENCDNEKIDAGLWNDWLEKGGKRFCDET